MISTLPLTADHSAQLYNKADRHVEKVSRTISNKLTQELTSPVKTLKKKSQSIYRDSDIMAAACTSSWSWWSELYARAYATLSKTSLPFKLYLQTWTTHCSYSSIILQLDTFSTTHLAFHHLATPDIIITKLFCYLSTYDLLVIYCALKMFWSTDWS